MTTAADYLGRRFDILAFSGVTETGDVLLSQTLFNNQHSGEVCTGVQKLSQRWLLEFMTRRGSMGFHLQGRGSDFLRWADQGTLRSEFDVRAYFNFAAQQVKTNLTAEDDDQTPDDERLSHSVLEQIAVQPGVLSLRIRIVSLSGDSRQVILPVALTPTNLVV